MGGKFGRERIIERIVILTRLRTYDGLIGFTF